MKSRTRFSLWLTSDIRVDAVRPVGIFLSLIVFARTKLVGDFRDINQPLGEFLAAKTKHQRTLASDAPNHRFADRKAENISPYARRTTVVGDQLVNVNVRIHRQLVVSGQQSHGLAQKP